MTSPINYLAQGIRIFRNSNNLKKHGFHKYNGDATEICTQIVKDCWNGRYFQTSTTHFAQFWTRDFGWCAESLLKLGYKKEVEQTLSYALNIFSRNNNVTTTITPNNQPFDFPTYAVDSLPWLAHSLALSKNKELISQFSPFIEKETEIFVKKVINPNTSLVKPVHFSSIKDFAVRKSSCYDNCMLALLSKSLKSLNLNNPLRQFDYPSLIKEHFWNGSYFYDDITKRPYTAADANIFPFYLNIITEKQMLSSAISAIKAAALDSPLPIRYTTNIAPVTFIWQEFFMRGYERDAIWTHLGPLYIKLVKRINKKEAKALAKKYAHLIETYKNYPEVLAPGGKPFTCPFYHCDQGMLWAANYLTL